MHPRTAILLAAGTVFVVTAWIPFGPELLYPLTLFTTWVHEMGHGMTALLVGGSFQRLEIFRDASGLASYRVDHAWGVGLAALGGLLAPPIVGTAILAFAHGPRRVQLLLAGLAIAIVVSMALFVRSTTGLVAMPVVALGLGAAALGWRAHPERRVILAQVLGVILAMDTLLRMVAYVFTAEVEVDGQTFHSDIANVADSFGGHYLIWGGAVSLVAISMLAAGVRFAWSRPAPLTR